MEKLQMLAMVQAYTGIGIGLMTRGLMERRPRVTVKKANKQAKKQAALAARDPAVAESATAPFRAR